jgi:hypothetical protein
MSLLSIASHQGGGGGGGRVGIGLTLKKRSAGDWGVSRVKLRGPVSPPHANTDPLTDPPALGRGRSVCGVQLDTLIQTHVCVCVRRRRRGQYNLVT